MSLYKNTGEKNITIFIMTNYRYLCDTTAVEKFHGSGSFFIILRD